MELFNLEVTRQYIGVLLRGLEITVMLTFIVITLAGILAVPVAVARMSRSLLIRIPVDAYVEIIRSTPGLFLQAPTASSEAAQHMPRGVTIQSHVHIAASSRSLSVLRILRRP